ncbi:hypothetical protein Fbal_1454 [Ferrimonas balearica DSM 9799]|uniref:Rap1a immunity protein domain-containing protein n=1 Tax=Ferrimonas balearica (strain DSM 9799 / CCM 4581 / KCTC 23876 / PAT) TaxID=550540 RepID=E1SNH4_FERBD|nr:hypothetical protein [Ferrimonas balearica]ADN75658.1 hypothetical protein Fbal_1454 [Ferrimonas balearica DSM 9799]
MRLVQSFILMMLSIIAMKIGATEKSQVFGSVECSSYSKNKNLPNMQFGYKNWWAGYLTGLGVTFEKNKSPEHMPEAMNFIMSIGYFCQLNPNKTMKDAVDSYIKKQIQTGHAKVT